MKLYFTKGTCSLTVRIIINEIGLSCEFIGVNLKTKRTEHDEDYLKINPKGAVPALYLDKEGLLTENAVILQYLADISNTSELLPPIGNFDRYHVLEWINYISTELHKSFGLLFNPQFPNDVKENIIKPIIKSKIKFVNNHLAHKEYVTGKVFTLPDAYLFVMITWLIYFKFDLKEWSHISRYFYDLIKRPSVHKSLEQEGIKIPAP